MRTAGAMGIAALALSFIATASAPARAGAEERLAAYQGAWLAKGLDCAEVYVSSAKGMSFRQPTDLFAPAFMISGDRLTTPGAACQIRSVRPSGDRQEFALDCVNAVAGQEMRVLMATFPDGSLKRFLNPEDTIGSAYFRCP